MGHPPSGLFAKIIIILLQNLHSHLKKKKKTKKRKNPLVLQHDGQFNSEKENERWPENNAAAALSDETVN